MDLDSATVLIFKFERCSGGVHGYNTIQKLVYPKIKPTPSASLTFMITNCDNIPKLSYNVQCSIHFLSIELMHTFICSHELGKGFKTTKREIRR